MKDTVKGKFSTENLEKKSSDKMDIAEVKKILSNHYSDNDLDNSSKKTTDKIIILEVESVEIGLKKASILFEVDVKEINHKILDDNLNSPKNKSKLKKIEYTQRVVGGDSIISISDDGMIAQIEELYPKKSDGTITTLSDIINDIRGLGIQKGLKIDKIKESLGIVTKNFEKLNNVIIATGIPAVKGIDSEITESIFRDLHELEYMEEDDLDLIVLLSSDSIEEISNNTKSPYYLVTKGEIIAKATMPGAGKPGKDLYANEIESTMGSKVFHTGKNIKYELKSDNIIYQALKTGYLHYFEGILDIVSPLWISEDEFSAYFIKLPLSNEKDIKITYEDIADILIEDDITNSILEENIDKLQEILNNNKLSFKEILLSESEIPKNGKDSKLELFFENQISLEKKLVDDNKDYGAILFENNVKIKQLIAVKYAPTIGTQGVTIKGKTIPPKKGRDHELNVQNNIDFITKDDKIMYYSKIDGRASLSGNNCISVNLICVVPFDVNIKSGNVDFEGDVYVKGSIMSGFGVNAGGSIFVSGSVSQKTTLKAGGNIEIKEGILGKDDVSITAEGSFSAKFLQNAKIYSKGDVTVKEYILNSNIKTQGRVITPDVDSEAEGKGSIIGGNVSSYISIVAKIIGSAISSNTNLIVGQDFDLGKNLDKIDQAITFCDKEIAKISKSLRLGVNDIDKIKLLLKQLPPLKRKPFIEAFKKLDYFNKTKMKLQDKVRTLVENADNLSTNAFISVSEQMFPNVLLQVGPKKTKTDKYLMKSKIVYNSKKDKLEMIKSGKSKS